MISYQTGGDHLLEPLGLRLVIQVDTAHQIISCYSNEEKIKHFLNTDTQAFNGPDKMSLLNFCPWVLDLLKCILLNVPTRWCYSTSFHLDLMRCYNMCTVFVPLPVLMWLSQTVQTIWTDNGFHYDTMSNDERKDIICHFINVTVCILLTIKTNTNHLQDLIREEMMLIILFFSRWLSIFYS